MIWYDYTTVYNYYATTDVVYIMLDMSWLGGIFGFYAVAALGAPAFREYACNNGIKVGYFHRSG
jgi:hypothetical protein